MISGCISSGVEQLVFCSTVDVAIGFNDIINGNEDNTPVPDTFLFPGYPKSKYDAECLVLAANGKSNACGKYHIYY